MKGDEFAHEFSACRRELGQHHAAVFRMVYSLDEAIGDQAVDEPRDIRSRHDQVFPDFRERHGFVWCSVECHEDIEPTRREFGLLAVARSEILKIRRRALDSHHSVNGVKVSNA